MTESLDLGRPQSGDVLDLILDDHRLFESLLRQLRDVRSDRDAVRRAFATLHVAHAEAEERARLPDAAPQGRHLRARGRARRGGARRGARGAARRSSRPSRPRARTSRTLVEELATAVNHHLTEEELTILNPAREEVDEEVRQRLGADFAEERNGQIEADCGDLENVRAIVEKAEKEGMLDDE